jgi:poly-beta-hydroxyalkanoate depolymerase
MDMMSYQFMELNQLALAPARFCSDLTGLIFRNPVNPLAHACCISNAKVRRSRSRSAGC